ncbi:MAG: Tyrosine recombinase XerC [bacterium]|nr:Tyrosine recombinase XerC [bacterium]
MMWNIGGASVPEKRKLGPVLIKVDGDVCWLRFTNASGRDVRKRFTGLTRAEIDRRAAMCVYEATLFDGKEESLPPIDETFKKVVSMSRGNATSREAMRQDCNRFITWLRTEYPSIGRWEDMRPDHVVAYARWMEAKGLAYDTVRLRLSPIKAAWKHLVESYDGVRPLPTIRLRPAPLIEKDCLTPVEVAALLDYLRENEPEVHPLCALQALCGLRILEAAHLRRCDVDWTNGTVTVTDTGRHAPKNRSSYRTLPACREVMDALRRTADDQVKAPASDELFTAEGGRPWNLDTVTQRIKRAMRRAAKKLENPRYNDIAPRRLRASFATMNYELGVDDSAVKRYMGHSGGDMLNQNYKVIRMADLERVRMAIEGWRGLLNGMSANDGS